MRGLCENCIHQEVCDFYRQEGADGFTMNCPFHKEERPHGKWIIIDDCEHFIAKCSVCGRIEDSRMVKNYTFCRCGADMRKEGD